MTDQLFYMLWTITWQSAVLAMVVWVIVLLFGRRIRPRWRYLLWSVVLLRLALPVLPSVPWGFFGHGDRYVALPEMVTVTEIKSENVTTIHREIIQYEVTQYEPATVSPVVAPVAAFGSRATWNWKIGVLAVWLAGIVLLAIRYSYDELQLYRLSRYWRKIDDPNLVTLLERCRRVELLSVSHGIGAAATGLFRPKILISQQALTSDPEQLRMVLLHELVHIRRFDPLVLRLTTILTLVHWANPVVWLVASRLQRERELACDTAVLDRLDTTHHKEYSDVLLTFAALFPVQERLPGLVGALQHYSHKNSITRRIDMMKGYKKSRYFHTLLGGLLVFVVAAFGLTRAQVSTQTQPNEPATASPENAGDTVPGSAVAIIHGIVVDSEDQPVSGAVVHTATWFSDPVVSDENGRFQMGFLKNFYLHLYFHAVLPETNLIGGAYLPRITGGSEELPEVKIVLKEGRRFFGQVVDEDGKPVASAYVGASSGFVTIEPVLTDEQGNFEFYFFQHRTHDIFAIKPGVGFDFHGLETRNNQTFTPIQQENGPLTLTLTKSDPISFHVEDESGDPLEGIIIRPSALVKEDGSVTNFAVNGDSHIVRKLQLFFAVTDKNGNAMIDWLPKGLGTMFFASDMQERYGTGRIPWQPEAETLSVQLARQVRLEGSVRLADGTPVSWASLALDFNPGNSWIYADREGNFSFPLNPQAKVSIVVESDLGAAPAVFGIEAGDGGNPPRVDFVLEKGAKFFGSVLAGPEKKPYSARVRVVELIPGNGIGRNGVLVDEHGNFEMRLPPGKYTAIATRPPIPGDNVPRETERFEFEIGVDETEKRIDFHVPYWPLDRTVVTVQ